MTSSFSSPIKSLLVCFCCAFAGMATAQYGEIGIAAGATNYQGDLSDPISAQNIVIGETRAAFGILGRYSFNRFWGIRGSLMKGRAAGYDSNSEIEFAIQRNLSFETDIIEASAIVEFNIFGFDPVYGSKRFSPYLFVGVAGYHFNPRAEFNGRLIDLQPLGLEGQGLPGNKPLYDRFSFAIPGGGGLKFAIDDQWFIGIEIGARKTFTDYLDDVSTTSPGYAVLLEERGETAALLTSRTHELSDSSPASFGPSTRGNSEIPDWYYFTVATITHRFAGGNGRRRSSGNMGCPKF